MKVSGCWFRSSERVLRGWEEKALNHTGWREHFDTDFKKCFEEFEYVLRQVEDGWELWPKRFSPLRPFRMDYESSQFLQRLKTFGKKNPLVKALGRMVSPGQTLIDSSAGWLLDALCLAHWGLKVTAYERNPVVYLLVRTSLDRAMSQGGALEGLSGRLDYVLGDSREALGDAPAKYDYAYFDPMYPSEGKKGVSEKSMEILKDLVGGDGDGKDVLRELMGLALNRVVIKRAPNAPVLDIDPNYSVESKAVRYDVYLT